MGEEWEYREGERFLFRGDHGEWSVDRVGGRVTILRKPLLRRPVEYAFALDDLVGVTLRFSRTFPKSLASVMNVLRTVAEMARSDDASLEMAAAKLPRGLVVRFDERREGARPHESEMALPVQGLDSERDMVALAYRVADAAALEYVGVFRLPGVGVEVRLAREHGPRLEALGELDSDAARVKAAAAAIAAAGPPPFEPHRFRSAYEVAEWRLGERVVLHRPFSKWAFALFPFMLLLLVGPGIVVTAVATGRELNVANTLILSVVAAAFGIPCTVLFLGMLPRSIVFDWVSRTLSIRRWPRTETIPLDRVLGVEAHARHYESSSEGGGSSQTYTCELKARIRSDGGEPARRVDLLETRHLSEPDAPKRDVFPLAAELAAALRVPHRTEDYSFTKTKSRR